MAAVSRVPRYIARSRVTKRPTFEFVSQSVHPDNTLMVFPFADERPGSDSKTRIPEASHRISGV
jgi:hypothetical protein